MYAVIYGRRVIRFPNFLAHFTSLNPPSDVSGGDAAFTVSYLTNSCGLSSNDAVSASKKLCIKSPESSDAVLQLLNKHGFTSAQISRTVTIWPDVLKSRAEETLAPKLEFLLKIGVPPAVLPGKISEFPFMLRRSIGNYLIPWYDYLKAIVRSDKNVAAVFMRSPRAFYYGWPKRAPSNIAILREKGDSKYSIASLIKSKPSMMIFRNEIFSACIDRAERMGFEKSKPTFVRALQLFGGISESTLKHKMNFYRMCGWSESELTYAFLRHPLCMELSEKQIRAQMKFLKNELGLKAGDVARCPVILNYSCEGRMKPRWIVFRALKARGLIKGSVALSARGLIKAVSITSLFTMSESRFLKKFIGDNEEEFPELLDVYRGKISPSEIGLDGNLISK